MLSRKEPSRNLVHDIRLGLACAVAFHQFSEQPILRGVVQAISEGPMLSGQDPPAGLGEAAASAANMAFAIELYLKVVLLQTGAKVSKGHDLRQLWDRVPTNLQDEVQRKYEVVAQDWMGKRYSLTFATGPLDPPLWDDYESKTTDIPSVLERARKCFEDFRYLWEVRDPDAPRHQIHKFEYGLLLSLCEALKATIIDSLRSS